MLLLRAQFSPVDGVLHKDSTVVSYVVVDYEEDCRRRIIVWQVWQQTVAKWYQALKSNL